MNTTIQLLNEYACRVHTFYQAAQPFSQSGEMVKPCRTNGIFSKVRKQKPKSGNRIAHLPLRQVPKNESTDWNR